MNDCSHVYNYKVVSTPTALWNTCISCILLCKYTEWALCMLLILQGCLSTSEPMHRPLFSRRTLQGMVLSAVSQHWLSRFQLGRLSGWHVVEGHPFKKNRIKRFCFKNDKNSKMKTKTETLQRNCHVNLRWWKPVLVLFMEFKGLNLSNRITINLSMRWKWSESTVSLWNELLTRNSKVCVMPGYISDACQVDLLPFPGGVTASQRVEDTGDHYYIQTRYKDIFSH